MRIESLRWHSSMPMPCGHRRKDIGATSSLRAGIPASILDGRGHPCPKCGGRDRFAAFHGLDARGAVHCRNCFTAGSPIRPGDGIQTLRWWLGCSFHDALTFVTDALGHYGTTGWAPTMSVKPAARPGPSQAEVRGHEQFARSCHERLDESHAIRTGGATWCHRGGAAVAERRNHVRWKRVDLADDERRRNRDRSAVDHGAMALR